MIAMKRGVLISFDVECSMGGAWQDAALRPVPPSRAMMGEFGRKKLGLPLIVDILADSGLAGTFFVEVFTEEQGFAGLTEPICQYLLDRGQDVQLHVHPNHFHYAMHLRGEKHPGTDQLYELPPDTQIALLTEGRDRIARWTGRPAVAFRSGNCGSDEKTLAQLAAAGIRIDRSYTPAFAGGHCGFRPAEPYNGSKWYGDVLEVALSGFHQPRVPALHPMKPLDLVGISFEECRDAVAATHAAGADSVVILHSFSLFKVRDVQYNGGRPNRVVIRRLRRFCRWLADNAADVPVYTFAELAEAVEAGRYEARAVPPCRLGSPLRAVTRKVVQAVNNLYWI